MTTCHCSGQQYKMVVNGTAGVEPPYVLQALHTPNGANRASVEDQGLSFQSLSVVSIVSRFYQRCCPTWLVAFPYHPLFSLALTLCLLSFSPSL